MEPLWLLWSGGSSLELLFRAPLVPLGTETPFLEPFFGSSWGGGSLGASLAPSGAEAPFGAPLAPLERRLFYGASLVPYGAETPFGALLAPLERRLFLGASLAPFGVETPSGAPLSGGSSFPAPLSGANLAPSEADPAPFEAVPDPSGTEAPLRSPSSSLWCQSGSLEWSRSGSLYELKNGSSWRCTGTFWSGTLLQSPPS